MIYDAVIIGSGHGGAVMAARLAPTGRVLVVERGRQWTPAQLPAGLASFAAAYRSRRRPLGLWDVRRGRGVAVGSVSGVGGASVVYYGITVAPEAHVFASWPVSRGELEPYLARALGVLRPAPDPAGDLAGDRAFLDRVEPGRREALPLTVDWDACTRCGDCVLGCRVGAKRGLDTTYLPIARAAGAEVRAATTVRELHRAPDGTWQVVVSPTARPRDVEILAARHVVVAAGTLGTLELLHGLQRELALSPRFGADISMNGDGAAFLYATRWRAGADEGSPVTNAVRIVDERDGRRRTLLVMSGRIPRVVVPAAAVGLRGAAALLGERPGPRADGGDAALARTFMYKLDGEDDARGQARFDATGRAFIDWPDYRADPLHALAAERLRAWAVAAGGALIRDLGTWPGMTSVGVHALGGCRMAARWDDGVVDDVGRVHAPGGGVVAGLHVLDGSVIPTSLGVPPSLTIAALAERAAEALAREITAARARPPSA